VDLQDDSGRTVTVRPPSQFQGEGAISMSMESELFGYEAGAFTGVGEASEKWEPGQKEGSFVSLRQTARCAARAAVRKVMVRALDLNQGNRRKTARLLKISYRSLLYKIKDAGIPRKGSQANSPAGTTAESIMKSRGLGYEPPTQ
jgi:DNA-binding NtrC family response regulator